MEHSADAADDDRMFWRTPAAYRPSPELNRKPLPEDDNSAVTRIALGYPVFNKGVPVTGVQLGRLPPDAVVYADEFGRIPIPRKPPAKVASVFEGVTGAKPIDVAKSFLSYSLGALPVATAKLKADAASHSISVKTLERAKKLLGIKALKIGDTWSWTWGGRADDR
jgi:hypothetical protein